MTEDYEPRFGEVWMWEDMGPFMVICPSPMAYAVNFAVLNEEYEYQVRLTSLIWDQPGYTYRSKWRRIDTEELGA